MSDETLDTDLDHYTIDDILSIFNIIDPTVFNVTDAANTLIAKMTTDEKPELVTFFTKARDMVLDYLQKRDKEDPVDNETTEHIENVWASKTINDKSDQKTAYFDDGSHITSKQKAQIKSASDEPIISSHIVVIDSQFRSSILPYINTPLSNAFNTSFTFNLSSPITKAVAMKLYSYHLPTSWNAFSLQLGNTFFIYNGVLMIIPDGNYTPASLVAALNTIALQNIATSGLIVGYNATTNRISFINSDTLIDTATMTFFIQANATNFTNCGVPSLDNFQTFSVNTTLGWLLGFRTTPNTTTGNVELFLLPNVPAYAEVPSDTYGPKYFTLNIEDYSNQRLSSGLYSITNTKYYTSLTVQNYYHTNNVACRYREGSLTQAQLFALNAISRTDDITNTSASYANTLTGFTSNSAFAVIPLADIPTLRPQPYIKFGADLFIYKRNYIKPTNIERFTVTLMDDKGNLVNLYDNDWSFTLVVDEKLN